jgi:glycosyltransferase involved in cell wall biosynthesis
LRIVFLNPSGELGGAETALLDTLAALRQARPAWALTLAASADGPLLTRATTLGIPSLPLTFPPAVARLGEWGRRGSMMSRVRFGAAVSAAAVPLISYTRRLRRCLAELDPDIVHSNGLKMHLLAARTCPPRARLVWHLHDYPQTRPLTAALLSAHVHRCSAILANSDHVADSARRRLGTSVPVRTMYNSVDLDRFHPQGPRADLDALAGLPPLAPGGIRVGLVGTFARWKGHDVFLDALSRVRSSHHVRGYIVGDSIYQTDASQFSRDELQSLADSCHLGEAIGFTGRVDDVPAVLRALDIVVHASVEPEPFGLVIAEAMACARPVVVSRAGGAAEIAQAGAVFHTPGSADDLAGRLDDLLADAARRASLGAAGRQTAERLFSRRRLCDTLIPVYEALAHSARS